MLRVLYSMNSTKTDNINYLGMIDNTVYKKLHKGEDICISLLQNYPETLGIKRIKGDYHLSYGTTRTSSYTEFVDAVCCENIFDIRSLENGWNYPELNKLVEKNDRKELIRLIREYKLSCEFHVRGIDGKLTEIRDIEEIIELRLPLKVSCKLMRGSFLFTLRFEHKCINGIILSHEYTPIEKENLKLYSVMKSI